MEKLYLLGEDYDSFIERSKHVGSGTEAEVYLYQDKIYKIFNTNAHRSRNKRRIRKLSEMKELDSILTIPKEELYIDYNFVGYTMDNGGIAISDYLFENELNNKEKLSLLYKIEEILIQLHRNEIIHGDIQASNILIKDDEIKLTDINNLIFKNSFSGYLNKLSKKLYSAFGLSRDLDIVCFNYLAFIIMCVTEKKWNYYLNLANDIFDGISVIDFTNDTFDDDYLEYQKRLIVKPNKKDKPKIDYITNHLK